MRPLLFLSTIIALGAADHRALAQQTSQGEYGLTAYRPQHGTGYHPFTRTSVPEIFEEHGLLGAGIRVNHAGEVDPDGEDDLIELVVARPSADAAFVLERSDTRLSVWRTRGKQPRTEVVFNGALSTHLGVGEAQQMTLWVEWTGTAPAYPVLSLIPLESDRVADRIVFHAFAGLVVALGGADQRPAFPVEMTHGTYRVAKALYERGWDVLMRDEDEVTSDGSGPVYDEVVNAIRNRSVRELAIFGYSHGGGSTYDLCERLHVQRTHIGAFSIEFTSYVDGIQNHAGSLFAERRKPLASRFHANQYQRRGFLPRDFPKGRPVASSEPPTSGLHVEDRPWGEGAGHYDIDDFAQVRDFIRETLAVRVSR